MVIIDVNFIFKTQEVHVFTKTGPQRAESIWNKAVWVRAPSYLWLQENYRGKEVQFTILISAGFLRHHANLEILDWDIPMEMSHDTSASQLG